jgi:hypothetical protein
VIPNITLKTTLFTLGWLIPDSNYVTHCHGWPFLIVLVAAEGRQVNRGGRRC